MFQKKPAIEQQRPATLGGGITVKRPFSCLKESEEH